MSTRRAKPMRKALRPAFKKQRRMPMVKSRQRKQRDFPLVKSIPTTFPKRMFVKLKWADAANNFLSTTFASADHNLNVVVYSMVDPGRCYASSYGGSAPSAGANQAGGLFEWAQIYNLGIVTAFKIKITFSNQSASHNEVAFLGGYPSTSVQTSLTGGNVKQVVEQNPQYFSHQQMGLANGDKSTVTLSRYFNLSKLYGDTTVIGKAYDYSTQFQFKTQAGGPPSTVAPTGQLTAYSGFYTSTGSTETGSIVVQDVQLTYYVALSQTELEID